MSNEARKLAAKMREEYLGYLRDIQSSISRSESQIASLVDKEKENREALRDVCIRLAGDTDDSASFEQQKGLLAGELLKIAELAANCKKLIRGYKEVEQKILAELRNIVSTEQAAAEMSPEDQEMLDRLLADTEEGQ